VKIGFGVCSRKETKFNSMKKLLLLFSMTFFCLILSAQDVKITINVENETIKSILNEIEKKSNYTFVYSSTQIDTKRKLSISARNEKVESVIQRLCTQAGLSYSIEGKRVVLTQKLTVVEPVKGDKKEIQVKGKVLDDENLPMAGAYVFFKNNVNICGVTSLDGTFLILADENLIKEDSLVVKYIGMKNIIVPYKAAQEYLFNCEQDVRYLEDVVVTGYQTLSRERSSGSFSIVKSTALESKTASLNVVDRLEGLVPGLSVNMSKGSEKFLMRGLTSINAARSPLVVIDGVPTTYETVTSLVNPNDVESISFLKDATAASIWGASAANGVINIVTKIGKPEVRRPKISYNSFISFKGKPDYDYQKMMNSSQLIDAAREVFSTTDFPWNTITNDINPRVYPHEKILYDMSRGLINEATANSRLDSLKRLDNREQLEKFLTRDAILTNHNLTFLGGSNFHSYYASYGYTSDNNYDKSSSQKHQINLRQIFNFTKNIKLDLTANFAYETGKQFLVPGLPATINNYLPYAMFEDNQGNPLSQAYLQRYEAARNNAETQSKINLDYIPVLENTYAQNGSSTLNARVSAGLDIKLLPGLQYQGKFQYQRGYVKSFTYYNPYSYLVRDELVHYTVAPASSTAAPTYYLPTTGGHYQSINNASTDWTVRNQLSFDRNIGEAHQFTALAGTEVRSNLLEGHSSYRRGFDMQTQTYQPYDEKLLSTTGVAGAILRNSSSGNNTLSARNERFSEVETRFFSLYANAAYTNNKKYTFNSSIRMDQSNLFGSNKSTQFKPIWSAGVSWNISREEFCNSRVFQNLVLRATFGYGGNSPRPGSGGLYDILYPVNIAMFGELGYQPALPGNKSISWERTSTTNIGIDYAFINDRLSGSIDIYRKRTVDLLGNYPIDPTTGWYFAYGNLGKISNDGFELVINSLNVDNKDFSWSTLFTLSYNRNKITELERNTPLTYSSKIYESYIEGYPAFSLFGFDYIGLNNNGNPVARNAKGEEVTLSSQLTSDDPVFGGVTQPKWFGGLTNEFSYKNFSLSALVIYNLGYQMRDNVNMTYNNRISTNLMQNFNDRWKQAGDEATTQIPKYIPLNSTSNSQRHIELYTQAVQNIISASYIKLRDITLTYKLSKKVSNKVYMDNISLYGQLNNLLIWANNKSGIDPEFYDIRNGSRADKMPPYFTIGLKVNFL